MHCIVFHFLKIYFYLYFICMYFSLCAVCMRYPKTVSESIRSLELGLHVVIEPLDMESNLVPLEGQCILITSKASLHLLHTLYLIFSNLVWWIFLLFFHSANERTKMQKRRQPMSREQQKDDLGCSTSRKKVYVSMNSGTIRVIS